MTIDAQLLSFMPHTVTIHPYSSDNNYGEPSYGTSRTAKAYVEPGANLSQGNEVNERSGPTTAYIADTSITIRDKIVMPDGRTPKIQSVAVHVEVLGLEHSVVQFL